MGCTTGAIGLTKGTHLQGVGIDLLRAKNAEADQALPGVKRRILSLAQRVPQKIDCGSRGRAWCGIRVVGRPPVEVTEDALARRIRQNQSIDKRPRPHKVAVEKGEEECFVLEDGS